MSFPITVALPTVLARFQIVVDLIIDQFKDYPGFVTGSPEQEDHPAIAIAKILKYYNSGVKIAQLETHFKHQLAELECWYSRCFALGVKTEDYGAIPVWNPLEQSFLAFKADYSDAQLHYYDASDMYPAKDILLVWIRSLT